jgi:hypothetical protein
MKIQNLCGQPSLKASVNAIFGEATAQSNLLIALTFLVGEKALQVFGAFLLVLLETSSN